MFSASVVFGCKALGAVNGCVLCKHSNAAANPVHLGYRLARNRLKEILFTLRVAGIAHVAINLKYGSRPAPEVVEEIAEHVLPHFPSHQ